LAHSPFFMTEGVTEFAEALSKVVVTLDLKVFF
jgi:hypothetical protein